MKNSNWNYRLAIALFFILVLMLTEISAQLHFVGGLAIGPLETWDPLLKVILWIGYILMEPMMIVFIKPWALFAYFGWNLPLDIFFFTLPWIVATVYTTILHLILVRVFRKEK